MELRAAVVARQPRQLLEMFGFEFHDRDRAKAMRLLPPRDQRLPEQAADGFPPEQPQVTGTRCKAEDLFRPRRAQPLEINRAVVRSRSLPARASQGMCARAATARVFPRMEFPVRPASAASRPRPHHFLNCRFATEGAAAPIVQRAAAQIDHVGFAALGFDHICVAGALQLGVGPMSSTQDVSVGMQFVGAGELARARHRHGVVPVGSAFRGEQVIPAVAVVEVRPFGQARVACL